MDVFVDVLDGSGDRRDKTEDSGGSDDVQLLMETEEQEALSLTLDVNGQYQFRADNGPASITYRVVHVTPNDDGQPQIISGLASNQAVLHGLANGSQMSEDSRLTETRLAYVPAAVTGIETRQGLNAANATTSSSVSPSTGPFFVMMAPSDVLQSSQQRTIMPRLATAVKTEKVGRVSRDDRRRATHNEVERRRRDKINCWILQLGRLVPEFSVDQLKQGDIGLQSKSVVLSKACEYILELQNAHKELSSRMKDAERCKNDLEHLQQSCEELKRENDLFRAHLQERGIAEDQLNDLPL